jgi:23S rRNA pseudouridine2605 synthase
MAEAIKTGRVAVNGEIVEDFRYSVDMPADRITVDGHLIDAEARETVYLMLNKPKGILSTTRDERGRHTIIDLLPPQYRNLRLYPVGRLDKDSSGLLILTNDGLLTYRLTHPKFEHEKEYLVGIKSALKPSEKRRLERGIKLAEGTTHPATVKEVKSLPPFNYSVTIHEGKKRQLRRMFQNLRYEVFALKRIRIGSLCLGTLEEGRVIRLSTKEVNSLLSAGTITADRTGLKCL